MRFLRDEKIRGVLYQFTTIVGFVLFIVYIAQNTAQNIDQRGIKTGFDFLNATAGFDITESPIPFSPQSTHWDVYKVGLLNTLIVSFWGIVFSTILGLILGVWRLSSNWLISKISATYIEIFRNIPLLLQILFWYNVVLATLPSTRNSINIANTIFINNRGLFLPDFNLTKGAIVVAIAIVIALVIVFKIVRDAKRLQEETGEQKPILLKAISILIALPAISFVIMGAPVEVSYPELKGFNFEGGLVYTPEFLALLFALSIYTATFIAEAIRSGIEAVPKGQKEAAISLGLSPIQRLRFVILPQAIRVAIPSIINQYLNLIKNSSLAAAIGYPELVTIFAGTSLNQTGQAIEILLITMLTYLTISLLVSLILNWFNNKMKIKER
jgi:general L-amino acid transport system permease protein